MNQAQVHRCVSVPHRRLLWAGLILCYLFFFFCPIFMNSDHAMLFPRYIPSGDPIGGDLGMVRDLLVKWVAGKSLEGSPPLVYPPVSRLLFCPLLLCTSAGGYRLVSLLTFLAFSGAVWITVRFGRMPSKHGNTALFLIPGLLSYGFQFELERGQFNVIAAALTVAALLVFHWAKACRVNRIAAYALFSAAIQMKLFPAVFVFAFTKDAKDWRGNIIRWGGLGAANIALLFVFGWKNFMLFLNANRWQSELYFGRMGVSVQSFAAIVQKRMWDDDWLSAQSLQGMDTGKLVGVRSLVPDVLLPHIGTIILCAGLTVVGVCFLLVLYLAWCRNNRPALAYLIFMATLVALLALGNSNAYKLPLLVIAAAWFVSETDSVTMRGIRDWVRLCAASLLWLGYGTCLFPATHLPVFMRSHVPALLMMAVSLAVLMITDKTRVKENRAYE
jgi:hypothetical protein